MKRIEDIEMMTPEELEKTALQQEIPVPSGLKDRIQASIAAQAALESKRAPAKWAPYIGVAAAAALATLVFLPRQTSLKDTYDDPYLAYAQVEATFQKISDKMAEGVDLAAKAGRTAEKPVVILHKINEQ